MQRLFSTLAILSWALWFGAVIALFVFVLALFSGTTPASEDLPLTAQMTAKREIAVQSAPQLFTSFQKYHLVLAAVGLIATVIWWMFNRSRLVLVNFILLAIATCCGIVLMLWFIGPMNALRERGLSAGQEFKRLHGQSMIFFMGQAIVLLIYGIILPFAIASDARKAEQTARETDSPA